MTEDVNPSLVPVSAAAGSGGSVAGRNYREQLARQGALPDETPMPAQAPTPTPVARPAPATVNARAAERKKVSGRARLVLPGGAAAVGKMVDMSLTGACVMMEDMLPSRVNCVLEFDIFHDGKRHVFSAPAVSVYGVLASGRGFKVGFQFGACSAVATKHLAELVA